MAYFDDVTKLWQLAQHKIKEFNLIPKTISNLKTRKRLAEEILTILENPLLREHLRTDELVFEQFMSISSELRQYQNIRTSFIEIEATKYFRNLFGKSNKIISQIRFVEKSGGVQLGKVMYIVYLEEGQQHEIKYYIKTHQYDSGASASSLRPPDLKELFIYKVLEFIGYGPKTHFFYDFSSIGSFYIATQDLGFTKFLDKKNLFIYLHILSQGTMKHLLLSNMILQEKD